MQGFTLLEIIIVVFIVGMLALVLIPRIDLSDGQKLRREALYLRNLLDWTWSETLYTGQTHRMVFDLATQAYRVERLRPLSDNQLEIETVEMRSLAQKGIRLGWGQGELPSEPVVVDFSPMGPYQPVFVQLHSTDGEQMAVRLYPGQPRATLLEP